MSIKKHSILVAFALALLSCVAVHAQDGAHNFYSPYSVYGMGDIYRQGNAYSLSRGGTGVAGRDHRYLNLMNPAAVTERDTLSFMMDFSFTSDNKIFQQKGLKSAKNTFNISGISFSVPIYKKMAFMFGITPFSDVAYDYSYSTTDDMFGVMKYSSSGNGGTYQLFGGLGYEFWNRLSVGAQFVYYFGNIDKKTDIAFSDNSIGSLTSGYTMELHAAGAKFGVQYEKPFDNDMILTLGATYRTGSKVKGYVKDYKYQYFSSTVDTLSYRRDTLSKNSKVKIASELGFGVSLRKTEKWSVELNYLFSNWSSTGLDKTPGFANDAAVRFSSTKSHSFRLGAEYIPNRNDVRYYMRRLAYRAGFHYDTAYYKVGGNAVNTIGLTLGVTFPLNRYYNGLTIGVDLGQRGSMKGNMTRERYAAIVIGFNIHDLWFIKQKYE